MCTDPHVVFPGNTQGRTVRETGPKGAVIVSVEDGDVVSFERVETDVLRWATIDVDCTGAAATDDTAAMHDVLTRRFRNYLQEKTSQADAARQPGHQAMLNAAADAAATAAARTS